MKNKEIVDELKSFLTLCKNLQKRIISSKVVQISNSNLKKDINEVASHWFSSYSKHMQKYGLEEDVISKYDIVFKKLLELSSNNNRKTSYENQFDIITKGFQFDIIIFMQTESIVPSTDNKKKFSSQIKDMLDKVSDVAENKYLIEAFGCWEEGYLKAAVVLAWCAAIDRIHRFIEYKGFTIFNSTSVTMSSQTSGRYKKFNKNFNIHSISELRTVFDSDILWILEGMGLIDINQKTRLTSCFDMRCHAGHPGDAPITEYNVLSCFSDIIEIVLASPSFRIQK